MAAVAAVSIRTCCLFRLVHRIANTIITCNCESKEFLCIVWIFIAVYGSNNGGLIKSAESCPVALQNNTTENGTTRKCSICFYNP